MTENTILIPGQGRLKRMRNIIFVFLGLAGIALWQTIAFKTTSGLIVTSILILCCIYLLVVLPIYWKNQALHVQISSNGISFGDARRSLGLLSWTKIESVQHIGKGMKEVLLLKPRNLDQLMSFVEDPKTRKGLERLTKIHGSPLGIQMLYFDEDSVEIFDLLDENIKTYG
jgi:hypothetical protein